MRLVLLAVLAAVSVFCVEITRSLVANAASTTPSALAVYGDGLARLDSALARLDSAFSQRDDVAVRRAFRDARIAYKRVEVFAEYYGEAEVRALNGVPLPKAEDEDPEAPLPPIGLQVVEGIVFPRFDTTRATEARQLVSYMRLAVEALARAGVDTLPGDAYVFDAMRHEVTRVGTLGIAGFDASASGDAMVESAAALAGVSDAMIPYRTELTQRDSAALVRFDVALERAISYLRANPDFDRFDRLTFITQHIMPTARALAAAQQVLGVGAPAKPRAWSARAASIYERNAVDPQFFASTDGRGADTAWVSLGRALFFDPVLSPSGTRSCASCHQPARAFTDGRAVAALVDGHRAGSRTRNTPTLLNAALQPTQFADNRARTLEDQAADVMGSAPEMGGSLARAASAVAEVPEYRRRFARLSPQSGVTPTTLRLAVAAYVRSLTDMNSAFDRALAGDTSAMSPDARAGFNVFMGRAKCGTCHFAPLFNGALPPRLVENEVEVLGVPLRDVRRGAVVDPDSGRFKVRRIDQHLYAFKTPTLRNVAQTAPYMHNGVFATLEAVVEFYDAGGGAGIGASLPHQTLPADSLHLSKTEKMQLIAFLESLSAKN